MNITERFVRLVIEEESSVVKPVFCEDGINFVWIRYSNLYLLAVYDHLYSTNVVPQIYKPEYHHLYTPEQLSHRFFKDAVSSLFLQLKNVSKTR